MAYTLRNRASARPGFRSLVLGLLLWPVLAIAAPVPPIPDTIAVNVDQAKLVKLTGKVATIVVGNPIISYYMLQSGSIIVVTGKSYCSINFMAHHLADGVLVDHFISDERTT